MTPGAIDWYGVYRALVHGRGRYRAWEVDAMTPAEVALALDVPDPDRRRPPAGAVALAPHEVAEYARRWRAMPLAERIRRAREGHS